MKLITESTISTVKIVGIVWLLGFLILSVLQGDMYWEKVKILSYLLFLYGFPMLLANTYFLKALSQSTPWAKSSKERFWKGLIGSVFISIFILFIANFVQFVLIWGADFKDLFTERNMVFYTIGLLLTIVISTFVHVRKSLQYKS